MKTLAAGIVTAIALGFTTYSVGNVEPTAYESGRYDGAQDLCGEVGGVWLTDQDGWCNMPD